MDTTQQQQQPIQQQQQQTVDYNNLAEIEQQRILKDDKGSRKSKPYVKILEQPASKALRFRYECEGRSAGSIPGVNSTPENKTYPTIEIVGYKGRAVVVVSCVTKDPPHRPHPHNLVGKDGCRKGVCTMEINSNTMQAVFSNLGIQCVKKKDIEAALKAREDIRVDPYKTGFTHRFQPSSIDLNSVRLCFQVFMESEQKGRFTQPLTPVVTDPIFDKKAMSDLVICRLSSCTSSVLGNTQIILLCEKVAKEDIAVRFYEEKQGHVVWEGYGDFQHTDVHKQAAITFKTPRYHTLDITDPVKVFIQLKRPSDGVTSDPLPFEYKPLDSDEGHLKRKRKKTNEDARGVVVDQRKIQHHQIKHSDEHIVESVAAWNECDVLSIKSVKENVACWNPTKIPAIKTEPTDSTPQSFVLHNLTPSPQSLSPHPNNRIVSPYNIRNVGSCTSTGQPLQTAIVGGQSSANYNPPMPGYSLNPELAYFMGNHFEGCLMNQGIRNSSGGALGGTHSNWCLNQQRPPPAHPSSLPQKQYNTMRPGAGENCDNIENLCSQQEHGLTNLLNIDSNLLVHIDSKDQVMLKLNTEELQLSNLSISS